MIAVDAHLDGKRFVIHGDEKLATSARLRLALFRPIAAENQLRNTSKRDGANNCDRANPLPAGWAERQESKSKSERSNSAKDEKRTREEAVDPAAAGSVNQAHCTHERERCCPQNHFQGGRCPKAERKDKPRYTPKKTRTWPPA